MKTVQLKFVIENVDQGALENQIQQALEQELNSFPLFCWSIRNSNKTEVNWKKNVYEKDR